MLNVHVDTFIHFLLKNRRMSVHTATAYRNDLEQFEVYISTLGVKQLEHLKSNHVRFWVSDLMSNGISARTVNRKLYALRSFFKFLRQEEKLFHNPMGKVIAPKTSKHLVKDIPAMDLEEMFARFPWEEFKEGQRDRLILLMLYVTGMRLSELIQLKRSDIDFGRNMLRVLGKRNKVRELPLHSELAEELHRYLENHAFAQVFVKDDGKPLYSVWVYRLVTHYLSLFSSAAKVSPHVLRHSFATHMLNNGAPLMAIKDLLGHTSLSATQVYTKNSFEKLKRIHALHPRK